MTWNAICTFALAQVERCQVSDGLCRLSSGLIGCLARIKLLAAGLGGEREDN